ncbi:hypothetical protein ACFQ2B_09690 [Streptomyces stramineus]
MCLGAGISARDGTPVETIVDNRNLGEHGTPGSPSTVSPSRAAPAGRGLSPARTGPTSKATPATSSRAARPCTPTARPAPDRGATSTPAAPPTPSPAAT